MFVKKSTEFVKGTLNNALINAATLEKRKFVISLHEDLIIQIDLVCGKAKCDFIYQDLKRISNGQPGMSIKLKYDL